MFTLISIITIPLVYLFDVMLMLSSELHVCSSATIPLKFKLYKRVCSNVPKTSKFGIYSA
jgi:hypothetical protein